MVNDPERKVFDAVVDATFANTEVTSFSTGISVSRLARPNYAFLPIYVAPKTTLPIDQIDSFARNVMLK